MTAGGMDQKQHAPGTPREYAGAFYRIRHKGRNFVGWYGIHFGDRGKEVRDV